MPLRIWSRNTLQNQSDGRVLSSGVLAQLRRQLSLQSVKSGDPIGLYLGNVCGTAQVSPHWERTGGDGGH